MVFEATVDTVAGVVLLVGLPLLIVLFYLEGIVLGKIFQPPAVFVTVVAVARPSWPMLVLLCGGCTLSVVAGQWTIFRSFDEEAPELAGVRRRLPYLESLPRITVERIGDRRFRIVQRLFERYGGLGIFVTTFLPGIRGLLAIPAGISTYPSGRFLAVSLLGNGLYFPLLVAVAFGIVQLVGWG